MKNDQLIYIALQSNNLYTINTKYTTESILLATTSTTSRDKIIEQIKL